MKPKPTTPERERAGLQQFACDHLVTMAAQLMIDDVKAPMTMIIDRFFTFAMAHAVSLNGKQHTAATLRAMAEAVEAGPNSISEDAEEVGDAG